MSRISREYDEIRFGKKSQIFFELSPYYFCTFEIGGKKWRTLIHYWVASYFKSNPYMVEMIRNLQTPEMAINVAKRNGFTDFNIIDSRYILAAIQERFNQNDNLRLILLSTGDVNLVYDGTGFLRDNNRYGRILMKVRDIYADK